MSVIGRESKRHEALNKEEATESAKEGSQLAEDRQNENVDREKQSGKSKKPLSFHPSLAFKMGLVSLARFGVLHDFLKWARS